MTPDTHSQNAGRGGDSAQYLSGSNSPGVSASGAF